MLHYKNCVKHSRDACYASCSSLVILGLSALLLGLVCYSVLHDFIASKIREGILSYAVLSSTSAGSWSGFMDSRDPSGPFVISTFYVYNITNPHEVLYGGKPQLQTIGPPVYHYINTKHNVSWENFGDDLLYKEYQRNFPVCVPAAHSTQFFFSRFSMHHSHNCPALFLPGLWAHPISFLRTLSVMMLHVHWSR